jgi:hypothetical protein
LWVAASAATSENEEEQGFSPWPVIMLDSYVIFELGWSR